MRCPKHPFDPAHDICTHCGRPWCAQCLVYPLGPHKDAFCVQCAVGRSVRTGQSMVRPIGRRALKARRRELADWRATADLAPETYRDLAPIPDVRPEDIVQPKGTTAHHIEWCV